MSPTNRKAHRRFLASLAALSMAAAIAAAACGSPGPTPSPVASNQATPSPTAVATPTPTPTPVPTATPLASIVAVPTSQLAGPSTAAAHLDDARAKSLQAALDGVRSSGKYPGASAAVLFPDGSIWSGVSGTATLSSKTPLTTDTLFSIGSISKTFVAALIGRLAMDGALGLDDPLSKYVPDFPNAANITIRQLLDHTSGIDDVFDPNGSLQTAILARRTATWTPAQVFARLLGPRFKPGANYYYSNTNYILLGLVAEAATGQTVAALVRSDFLQPLAITHTFLQTEEPAPGPAAHGYMAPASQPVDQTAGTMLPFTAEATAVGFAGAYVSTASDLAVWANALYGGNVLDQATLASMVDISQTAGLKTKPNPPYGFGFELSSVAGQLAWGHRGHLDGFWSAMEYLPDSHVTIVVLTNADWADPVAASSVLAKIAIS